MLKPILLTLSLCFSSELLAREILLATVTGNIDTDTSYFSIEVNESGDLDTVRFKTVTRDNRITQDSHFPVETVDQDGVVLIRREGRDVLRLETVKPFSFSAGGEVRLRYLYSGVTNAWKSLKVKLGKSNTEFEIRTLEGMKTTRFFTKGNWHPILGLVGISELEPRP